MSQDPRYFKIGLFVLAAAALGVSAIIVFGAGTLFEKKARIETYIDETVQGLDVGAPLKYRGVTVGRLEEIAFVRNKYEVKDNRIYLRMAIFLDRVGRAGQGEPWEVTRQAAEDGLRVRLASQGLTGGVYLELDYLNPKDYPEPPHAWTSDLPVLPSAPSIGTRLTTRVESVLERLEKIRFNEMSDKLIAVIDGIDKLAKKLESPVESLGVFLGEARGLVGDTRKALRQEIEPELRATLSQLREMVEKDASPAIKGIRVAADRLPGTLDKADAALEKIRHTFQRADRTLSEESGSIGDSIESLRTATQDLQDFMQNAKRYPSYALFGEPPPKIKALGK